jgi:hypothetical protein
MKLPRYLQILLAVTLLIVGVMAWRDHQSVEEDLVPARVTATRASRSAAEQAPASTTTTAAAAVPDRGQGANLFPPQTWRPAPPPSPPPVATTSSKPSPPSLPFTVTGEWRYLGEQPIVLLQRGGETYLVCADCDLPGHVRPGQRLGADYRLDEIGPRTITLTYLPLHHPYTLSFGAR